MTKEEYINEYKKVLKIKNLLPNTINTYIGCLVVFLDWCELRDIYPPEITKEQLRDFLSQFKSYSYLKQQRGTIDNFYKYVLEIPYILTGMPFPKKHKSLPEYFTVYEVDAIFKAVKNNKHRIILKLMYNCGLRVHEVVKVNWKDFICQGEDYDLKVIGKGAKHDLIPVPKELTEEIIIYMGNNFGKNEPMFKGQFKETYSTRSVQIILHRAMESCGINKCGSTHLFRHSIGTHLAQNGFNSMMIKSFLRHESIKTSEIYIHLSKNDLRLPLTRMRKRISDNIKNNAFCLK